MSALFLCRAPYIVEAGPFPGVYLDEQGYRDYCKQHGVDLDLYYQELFCTVSGVLSPQSMLCRLTELESLPQDWDPDGAARPDLGALTDARLLAAALTDARLYPSSISPSVEEGVAFNFRRGPLYACIEILNEGSVGVVLSAPTLPPGSVQVTSTRSANIVLAVQQVHSFLEGQ